MTCKHCTMRDIKRGNIIYTEGERYEHPPYYVAYIYEEHDGFWMSVETRGWSEGDDSECAYIPVEHCPWCGEKLSKEGGE